MADPLSVTAGVVGLVAFAGSTLTKGYRLVRTLKSSGKDLNRLLAELSQLTGILVALESQEREARIRTPASQPDAYPMSWVLDSSIANCRKLLGKTTDVLQKLEKSRPAVLAIKWQLLESDIQKLVQEIEHHKTVFALCLGIDTRKQTDEILELQKAISTQLEEMRNEGEKQKTVAQEDTALVHDSSQQYPAGWGKTVLMACIVEELKARAAGLDDSVGLAYFNFSYKGSESYVLSQILNSLTAQLIRCCLRPESGPAMRLFEECDDGTVTPNADRLQELLIKVMSGMKAVYLCLDALDECSPGLKNEILQFVYVIIGQCENVKVLVCSRTGDSEVSEMLEGCLSITISPRSVAQDIELYVRSKIEYGSKRLRRALSDTMIERILAGAEGMFLWVSYQMDQLARLKATADVHKALDSLPRGLYGTYNHIIEHVPPEDELLAIGALRWLAHAAVPLSLDELVEAIAIDEKSSFLGDLQKLMVPEDIFQICGSLVRRSETSDTLSLAHSSIYEFFTAASQPHRPASFHFPIAQSRTLLAEACLTYLSFQDFRTAGFITQMSLDEDTEGFNDVHEMEAFPDRHFFDHALRNWWKYLPTSLEDLEGLWPSLIRFFDSEEGNFACLPLLLHNIEGTYKYPLRMQPIHFCATQGLYAVAYRLLSDTVIEIECEVEDGRRSLHMAAENNHHDLVQLLLSRNADPSAASADGRVPLQIALESGNESIAQLLIRSGADVNSTFANGETPLSVAVGNNSISHTRFLIKEKADPDGRLPDGRASLHVAAEVGCDTDILRFLIDSGADPTSGDDRLWTPLHYAAHRGHRDAAFVLMDNEGIDGIFERVGWTPLHAAIQQEHTELVKLFIGFANRVSRLHVGKARNPDPPAMPSSVPRSGKARGTAENVPESSRVRSNQTPPAISRTPPVSTPLFLATSQDYLEGVIALLKAGAGLRDLEACIEVAFLSRRKAILERLVLYTGEGIGLLLSLSKKATPNPRDAQVTLRSLFESFHWNAATILTAMREVLKHRNQQILEFLIEQFSLLEEHLQHQAKKRLIDVLQTAVKYGNLEAVDSLQHTGVELSQEVISELVRVAIQLPSIGVACTLLKTINPNVTDTRGRTLLHYAVQNPYTQEHIGILLLSGADVSPQDDQGCTPLHIAAQYDKGESVSCLMNAGAPVNVLDNAKMTPLHYCAFSLRLMHEYPTKAMLHLLEAGASTTSLDEAGHTPSQLALITAIKHKLPTQLSYVLDQDPELISAKLPPLNRTALHLAAEAGCEEELLRVLFERKVDLEAEDDDGKTPAQIAGGRAHRLLINRGARWK